ncbi:hypothetical protein CPC735_053480 [Coccidioides posadasii C735 delta SOWgp]|uniref:Uncharacterized protein n=2 Tax=Coccidioides posadasii TaxID=199306 RepID=A0A0J6EY62_COCPO|nr:hypothetical protein CPC735_053480 [Coccidioides posadasii C735 delta SOWgp]EER23978.1 hypothetical protein CPC735_053480 [Coccidioides posadasii C735 delta SOWgp]KMM65516.1 hypothetical protein CPAG_01865 [Coccidioides posadasii RMSCC 3488]|eukprot:XP_003066123.1 hypothetical protein CPC735_053480 [Coccidioides posadasii C735 delta SOWgp]
MCMQATCSVCEKKTWRGCGQHVPSVMDHIPKDQWCTCTPKTKIGETEFPPKVGEGKAQAEEK